MKQSVWLCALASLLVAAEDVGSQDVKPVFDSWCRQKLPAQQQRQDELEKQLEEVAIAGNDPTQSQTGAFLQSSQASVATVSSLLAEETSFLAELRMLCGLESKIVSGQSSQPSLKEVKPLEQASDPEPEEHTSPQASDPEPEQQTSPQAQSPQEALMQRWQALAKKDPSLQLGPAAASALRGASQSSAVLDSPARKVQGIAAVQLSSVSKGRINEVDSDIDSTADGDEEDPTSLYEASLAKAAEAAGDGQISKDETDKVAAASATAAAATATTAAPTALEEAVLHGEGAASLEIPKLRRAWKPKDSKGEHSLLQTHAGSAVKLDSDLELMEGLYTADGSLPTGYDAWQPPKGAAADEALPQEEADSDLSFLQLASKNRNAADWCAFLAQHRGEVPALSKASKAVKQAEAALAQSRNAGLELRLLSREIPATEQDVQGLKELLKVSAPEALLQETELVLEERQKVLKARTSRLQKLHASPDEGQAKAAVATAQEALDKTQSKVQGIVAKCSELGKL